MTTATTPAHGTTRTPTVSLFDRATALATVDQWIEEHADEVIANGGELTPALAQVLEQAEGDFKSKIERVGLKCKEFSANAEIAKGMKTAISAQASAMLQRERMWENAVKSLKQYAGMCLAAANLTSSKTPACTVRIQNNPETLRHVYQPGDLLAIADAADECTRSRDARDPDSYAPEPSPIARFITVTRSATIDTNALLLAMQARYVELMDEADALGWRDLDGETIEQLQAIDEKDRPAAMNKAVDALRSAYAATEMQRDFPGCTIVRGAHVRIS